MHNQMTAPDCYWTPLQGGPKKCPCILQPFLHTFSMGNNVTHLTLESTRTFCCDVWVVKSSNRLWWRLETGCRWYRIGRIALCRFTCWTLSTNCVSWLGHLSNLRDLIKQINIQSMLTMFARILIVAVVQCTAFCIGTCVCIFFRHTQMF